MTASSPTTIPRSVRVDAASPTPWSTRSELRIVHLGHTALVLADGPEHLVITSEQFGLAPGGIQLLPADLHRLRAEMAAGSTGLSHWTPALVDTVDLTMRAVDIDPMAVVFLGDVLRDDQHVGAFDSSRQRSAAAALVRSAQDGQPVGAALLALIGAGPGSTPAGDDVVVGVLAGLHASGRDRAARLIERSLPGLVDRTTSSSRHYLSAAASGRFAERVHQLVCGLGDRTSALEAARSASRWGATSGLDLLAGVMAAIDPSAQLRRTA
ncbi:MAG: DUF2877 domain-containing protein [Rhodoglobus sp.]